MATPTILTCAVTGNLTTRAQHPRLPITPEEIATAAIDAAKAGAAVVHLHVRDPETGRGSMDLALFREIVARIRDSGTDVILNLSTGEGGRFLPSDDDPSVAAPGTTLTRPEKRVVHVEDLKPEICTLDFNTMFSGSGVVINTPRNLESWRSASMPRACCRKSKSSTPATCTSRPASSSAACSSRRCCFNSCWACATADPQTLAYYAARLPKDAKWAAFGIGRMAFPMVAQSWLLGGHVRVGLEDNVYIRKGVLARDNAELVEKAVGLVETLGGRIATVGEARAILAQ